MGSLAWELPDQAVEFSGCDGKCYTVAAWGTDGIIW